MKTNEEHTRTALITDIQRFCMHDGPGVRTTVFFKGCPLHCKWCHNPETQNALPEISFVPKQCVLCGACENVCPKGAHRMMPEHSFDRSLCISCGKCAAVCPANALTFSGKRMTTEEIMREVEKDRPFYGKDGGLTVSGGEPTMQREALFGLLGAAKEAGISTALETCGCYSGDLNEALCSLTDLFLFDIKDTDPVRLRENTGADLQKVLANLHTIDGLGGETVIRCILIPDVNMNEGHVKHLAELYKSLSHCRCLELLPYHPYGASKAEHIGREALTVYRIPEKQDVLSYAAVLAEKKVPVKCFGSVVT